MSHTLFYPYAHHRTLALAALWRAAADSLAFRYPDSRTWVEVLVAPSVYSCEVEFLLWNARCTVNPDEPPFRDYPLDYVRPALSFYAMFEEWPGYAIARMALLGLWLAFAEHEACELVADRTSGERFVDPHAGTARPHLHSLFFSTAHDPHALAALTSLYTGPEDACFCERQLEVETAYAAGEIPVDQ